MAVTRRDPIPPGVHWLDVFVPFTSVFFDPDVVFQDWVAKSGGTVRVLHHETLNMIAPGGKAAGFYTFEVTGTPAPFPFRTLGFPNVVKLASAPGGVTAKDRATTADDVIAQRPPPEEFRPFDFLKDVETQLAPTLERFAPWIVLGIGLYLWSQSNGRTRHALH